MLLLLVTGLGVVLLGAFAIGFAAPLSHLLNRQLEASESSIRATAGTTRVGAFAIVLVGIVFVVMALTGR